MELREHVRGERELGVAVHGGRGLGGEHEDVAAVVLAGVRLGMVDRVEDCSGVRLPLLLGGKDLLEDTDLDRGLVESLISMLVPEGVQPTHIEHGQRVRDARVAPRERALDFVTLQVPLDERTVRLLQQEPVDLLIRPTNDRVSVPRNDARIEHSLD